MLLRNLCPRNGLANGSLGTVVGFQVLDPSILEMNTQKYLDIMHSSANETIRTYTVQQMPILLVQFDAIFYNHQSFLEDQPRVVPIVPMKYSFKVGKLQVERYAYPLRLGWAFTIHKVQGLTLDRLIVDLSSSAHIFAYAQVYVAITRVKDWNGLRFGGRVPTLSEIQYAPKFRQLVQAELRRLQDCEQAFRLKFSSSTTTTAGSLKRKFALLEPQLE